MESESIVKISINSSTDYVDLIKTLYMFFIILSQYIMLVAKTNAGVAQG